MCVYMHVNLHVVEKLTTTILHSVCSTTTSKLVLTFTIVVLTFPSFWFLHNVAFELCILSSIVNAHMHFNSFSQIYNVYQPLDVEGVFPAPRAAPCCLQRHLALLEL
jgi:hypothetical protein